jgi:hypothetical protein
MCCKNSRLLYAVQNHVGKSNRINEFFFFPSKKCVVFKPLNGVRALPLRRFEHIQETLNEEAASAAARIIDRLSGLEAGQKHLLLSK